LKGLYDLENGEILVGEEFWNFVAGADVYEELLDVFQEVGDELRSEIDQYFAKFSR
jgi:type II restriction enzyme